MEGLEHRDLMFAKSLASNVRKTRYQALKALRSWLGEKDEPSDLEMMKIWKGLYYCMEEGMWLSDKRPVQYELAERMGQLQHCFSSFTAALTFLRAFYNTMAREWLGIDRLRLDKYYNLIRQMVRESFELLKKEEFTQEAVQQFSESMCSCWRDESARGLFYHICDCFLPELERVAYPFEFSGTIIRVLLQPFINITINTIYPSSHTRIRESVFERMLTLTHREHLQASGRLNEDGEMVKDEQNEADTEKPRKSKRTRGRKPAAAKTEDAKMDLDSLVYLPYFESMSEVFLEASSSESTPQRSANEVYNLQTSFQSTAAEDGKTAVVIVDDRSKETARKKKRKRKVARKKMGEKSFKRMRSKQ